MLPPETINTTRPVPAPPVSAAARASAPAPSAITCSRSARSRTDVAASASETAKAPARRGRARSHMSGSTALRRRRRRTTARRGSRPAHRCSRAAVTGAPVAGSQGEDRRSGADGGERARDPGRQAAAAPRDQHRVDVVELLGQLEPDGAVARHHSRVAHRVHEVAIEARERPRLHGLPPRLERHRDGRPPSRSIASSLACGAWSGTTMVASTPVSRAIQATPCAMLLALVVQRPRATAAGDAVRTALAAPRSLNDPIGCRHLELEPDLARPAVAGEPERAVSAQRRRRPARGPPRSRRVGSESRPPAPIPRVVARATHSSAAARSSIARPSDLKSVSSVSVARPSCMPASTSPSSARM